MPKATGRSKNPNRRATNAEVLLRVEEVLRIRLDGAEFWDIRDYVREKEKEEGSPWFLKPGEEPMSDTQIWRYSKKADDMILEAHEENRDKLYRRHLAQRRRLYARAVNAGDIGTALRVLRDEAQMIGLYPSADDAALKELEKLKGELDKSLAQERDSQGQGPDRGGQEPGPHGALP
jgi:hypothetical protein